VRWLVTTALLGVLLLPGGSSARSAWTLSGTWHNEGGDVFLLRQTLTGLHWDAHSKDNHTWGHKFDGTIRGDTFSGRYADQPGYSRLLHGSVSGRIVDGCHIDLVLTVDENGDRLTGSITRPCPAVKPPVLDAITSYGPANSRIKLRFRVRDNYAGVNVRAVVYARGKPIRSYATRAASANGVVDTYWFFKPPAALRGGADLEFCVIATNAAQRSAKDCAALSVFKA
jgi:hypothetical protein